MTDQDIITRNTRNGYTSWQNVARQLGRSIDSVRAQYDHSYMRAHIWAPTREPEPEMEEPPCARDTSSPYIRGPILRVRIISTLSRHTASAQTLASMVGTTIGCARVQLSALKSEGIVQHTARMPYTWSLTDKGKAEATTGASNASTVGA